MMLGLKRRLLYNKPKKTDASLLAQFYFADVDLCNVAAELDSFDGRKNPARCAALVAQLRQYQDRVLKLMQSMMDEVIKEHRTSRDFRVKYPEDLIQDGLAGQLWFGAECLAAGSSILNREVESESMRPIAKSLTKQLDSLRQILRDQSIIDPLCFTDKIRASFIKFDHTFAEFELSYVSAMVPVKTMKEYDMSQEVTALFSETVQRALAQGLITRDMLEYYDPVLMFTIPRLAIVSGLVIFPEGPLNPDRKSSDMSEMFRPFQSLLKRIRELLWTLCQEDLRYLEKVLCNLEDSAEKKQSQISVAPEMPTEAQKEGTSSDKTVLSMHLSNSSTSANTTSLFNNISNLNDFHQSSSNLANNQPSNAGNDFRTTLLDVLTGSHVHNSNGTTSGGPTDMGNNNVSIDDLSFLQPNTISIAAATPTAGLDPLGVQRFPLDMVTNGENAYENLSPSPHTSSVIINDPESGVARLLIGDASDSSHSQPDQPSSSAIYPSIAATTSHDTSAEAPCRPGLLLRQQSTSSTHSEFAFNLPDSTHDVISDSEQPLGESSVDSSDEDLFNGCEEATNSVSGDGAGNKVPSRVTVNRTISHEDQNTSGISLQRDETNRPDSESSTDSSSVSSPGYLSDMETSSSSDESTSDMHTSSHRRHAFKSMINTKSENLKKPHKNTEELIQKLFICVSGVADQLQSNFACDLRNILKCVFELHTGDMDLLTNPDKKRFPTINTMQQSPPTWIPDAEMNNCCSCKLPFTLLRRRHHCRNCGLIFCGRCSSNTAPLPNIGYEQAVRICNKCYIYRVNPFFMDNSEESYNSRTSSQQP